MSVTFPPSAPIESNDEPRRIRNILDGLRLLVIVLLVAVLSLFVVVVPVGERGVLLQLGAVQPQVLDEGMHIIVPGLQSVITLNVRLQSHLQESEAATSDLQDVGIDLAVAWHCPPDAVPGIYQRLGDNQAVIKTVLEPAIEDSIKVTVHGASPPEQKNSLLAPCPSGLKTTGLRPVVPALEGFSRAGGEGL
ncbi:MAG: SPFH domain-containing protein, partial [Cyanobacteriota bacterium]